MEEKRHFFGINIARIFLVLWSIAVACPLVWVIYSSLKSNRDFYKNPWALPTVFHFENYYNAWITSKFSHYFLNSIFLCVASLVVFLIMATTSAYIFAKYNIKALKPFENIYIIGMMIPATLLIVPLFFQVKAMNMTNSLLSLVLLYALQGIPFSIFMLTGFMKGIHNSFIEAAVIDGCSEFSLFFRIIAPISKAGIFIIGLMHLMGSWNEYVMALTFLSDENKFTIPIGISYLSSAMQYRTDFGALFAGLTIGMVPILIIYAFFQRQLQEGISANSGVKG